VVIWPKTPETRVVDAFFMGQIFLKSGPKTSFSVPLSIFCQKLSKKFDIYSRKSGQ
jgi:hypothetical protein